MVKLPIDRLRQDWLVLVNGGLLIDGDACSPIYTELCPRAARMIRETGLSALFCCTGLDWPAQNGRMHNDAHHWVLPTITGDWRVPDGRQSEGKKAGEVNKVETGR